jgi:hypothetical protein
MNEAIQTEGLTKLYGDLTAVDTSTSALEKVNSLVS